VDLLIRNFEYLNRVRAKAQAAAVREYDSFRTALGLKEAPANGVTTAGRPPAQRR
jgi:hypothetical protein